MKGVMGMLCFVPNMYIPHYSQLKTEILSQKGIKMLLIDVDNTLIPYHTMELSDEIKGWIESLKKEGLIPVLISNNHKNRVSKIAQQLNIPFYAFSRKPAKQNYKKALRDHRLQQHEVASLGDQLITDVCGGNRMGIFTILQEPLEEKENAAGKISRFIESKILVYLEKQGTFKKGEYYE